MIKYQLQPLQQNHTAWDSTKPIPILQTVPIPAPIPKQTHLQDHQVPIQILQCLEVSSTIAAVAIHQPILLQVVPIILEKTIGP